MEIVLKYENVMDVFKYILLDYGHTYQQKKIPRMFPPFAIGLINLSFLYDYFIKGEKKKELLIIFSIELFLFILFFGLPFRYCYKYYKHRNNLTYFIDLENFTINCKNDNTGVDTNEFTIEFKKSYLRNDNLIYLFCIRNGKHTVFFIDKSMCDISDFNELISFL